MVGASSDVYFKAYDFLSRFWKANEIDKPAVIVKNEEKSLSRPRTDEDDILIEEMGRVPYSIRHLKECGRHIKNGYPVVLLHVDDSYEEFYEGYLKAQKRRWE